MRSASCANALGIVTAHRRRHAAETVLWPALLRLNARYPDIKVEVSIEPSLTDIVTEQYDAGVRRGNKSPGT